MAFLASRLEADQRLRAAGGGYGDGLIHCNRPLKGRTDAGVAILRFRGHAP